MPERTLRGTRSLPQAALPGFTLLEVVISSAIFLLAVAGFLGAVQLSAKSMGFQGAVSQQVRLSEEAVDNMMLSLRWISLSDPQLRYSYPVGQSTAQPMISFRRVNGADANGKPIFGDTITYYWLPSARENPKYLSGAMSLWDPADIDGKDHDGNSVCNDGVIWRKMEGALVNGQPVPLSPLGSEYFGANTSDLRVVVENVPAPFSLSGGTIKPLDSFRVDVDATNGTWVNGVLTSPGRTITLTIKRFVDTGERVLPDMQPMPAGVPTSESVIDADPRIGHNQKRGTVTVISTKRRFCVRN